MLIHGSRGGSWTKTLWWISQVGEIQVHEKERRLIFDDLARPSRGRSYLHLAWRRSQWNQAIDEGRTNSLRGPLFEPNGIYLIELGFLLVPPSVLIFLANSRGCVFCIRLPFSATNFCPFFVALILVLVEDRREKGRELRRCSGIIWWITLNLKTCRE